MHPTFTVQAYLIFLRMYLTYFTIPTLLVYIFLFNEFRLFYFFYAVLSSFSFFLISVFSFLFCFLSFLFSSLLLYVVLFFLNYCYHCSEVATAGTFSFLTSLMGLDACDQKREDLEGLENCADNVVETRDI